jgi:hypothetical protein
MTSEPRATASPTSPAGAGGLPWRSSRGVLMMGFLATFGVLVSQDGPGGVFEKLASLTPTLFGTAVVVRLLASGDARIATVWPAARVAPLVSRTGN